MDTNSHTWIQKGSDNVMHNAYHTSPLETINAILLSDEDFWPSPDEPIGSTESVIEELSLFEKAVYTAMQRTIEEHQKMVDEYVAIRQDERAAENVIADLRKETILKKELYEFFDILLHTSIRQRLQIDYEIEIRRDYQIVKASIDTKAFINFEEFLLLDHALTQSLIDCGQCKGFGMCHHPSKKSCR